VDQLKKAGVDLTKEDAFKAVVNRLAELVNELEIVLKS
jgi:oligoendopeptidase F